MRTFFKIGLFAAVSSVLFVSCLKDTATTDYSDSSIKPVVLIPNGNWPSTQSAPVTTFEVSTTPVEIPLYARVSWSKPLGKAIDVTFTKNTALIADYNAKWGTHYVEMNADAYSVASYKITIAADQNEAYIPLKIFTDKVSLSQDNMLAFTISDASGEVISSNFKNIILPIGVKNRFDGVYTARIYSKGWGAYGIADDQVFSWPSSGIKIITAGGNVVTTETVNFGSNLLPAFTSAGGATQFGATSAKFTFDAANKLVDVVNTTPDDGRGRALIMDPSITTSRYDPATKKLYLAFIMKQTGRPDQFFRDTLTWFKSR